MLPNSLCSASTTTTVGYRHGTAPPTDPAAPSIRRRSNAFDSFGPPLDCWLLGLQGETFDVTVSKDDVALSKGSYAFAALRAGRWRGLGACRVLCVFVAATTHLSSAVVA
jgi:hypothetical protein